MLFQNWLKRPYQQIQCSDTINNYTNVLQNITPELNIFMKRDNLINIKSSVNKEYCSKFQYWINIKCTLTNLSSCTSKDQCCSVAKWSHWLKCRDPMWVPAWVPPGPLLIQFPANAPGAAADAGLSARQLAPTWETWKEFLAQPRLLQPLQSKPVDQQSLHLSPSPTLPFNL